MAFAQKSAHYGAPKFEPPDGKKMLIVGQDLGAVGGLTFYTNGYVNKIKTHVPAGVTTYTAIPEVWGVWNMANWGAGDIHAQAYVQDGTFQHSFFVFGLYVSGRLGGIINGVHDDEIQEFGEWIKDQDRPIFVRIGYEVDGPWNAHDPAEFRDAWRHIVHIFDEMDIRNVAYVWQVAGINTANIDRWWPGDEYVNWLGYSHFDEPNPGANLREFAKTHDKPIMIAESTPRVHLDQGSGEGHWLSWYKPLFDTIYAHDNIKALAYINVDWESQPQWQGQGWGDSRLHLDEFVEQTWTNEIAKEPWVTATDSLKEIIQYQTWIDSSITNTREIEFPEDLTVIKTSSHFSIRSQSDQHIEQIFIWNYSGTCLYSARVNDFDAEVPLAAIPDGWMVIGIARDGHLYHKKEVVIRN